MSKLHSYRDFNKFKKILFHKKKSQMYDIFHEKPNNFHIKNSRKIHPFIFSRENFPNEHRQYLRQKDFSFPGSRIPDDRQHHSTSRGQLARAAAFPGGHCWGHARGRSLRGARLRLQYQVGKIPAKLKIAHRRGGGRACGHPDR